MTARRGAILVGPRFLPLFLASSKIVNLFIGCRADVCRVCRFIK